MAKLSIEIMDFYILKSKLDDIVCINIAQLITKKVESVCLSIILCADNWTEKICGQNLI